MNYEEAANQKQVMDTSEDNRLMAMLIYVLSFFTGIIGPILLWVIKRKDSKLVDAAGKTFLNSFISYMIYAVVGVFLMFLSLFASGDNSGLAFLSLLFVFVGLMVLTILSIISFVCTIIACIKYFNGELYQMPLTISFFKWR